MNKINALNYLKIEELKNYEKEKMEEIQKDLTKYFPEIHFRVSFTIEYRMKETNGR